MKAVYLRTKLYRNLAQLNNSKSTHRQKTIFTTLGIFLDGFSVSPAVMPKLSVPPSAQFETRKKHLRNITPDKELTRKTRGNKHIRKPAKSADEWRSRYMPIMPSDIVVFVVDTDIHEDADDNKDHDRGHLQRGKPIFCGADA